MRSGSLTAVPHLWLRPLPELDSAAPPLSAQERLWCAALPAARRGRYAGSRVLLRRCLGALHGLHPEEVPLWSPPGEAPRLADGLGCVSLSHSRDHGLLAWSPTAIGVDLEWAERLLAADALARRFFPAEEAMRLQALSPVAQVQAVLESWVRKEAAIKWQRSALSSDLRHWCWDAQRGELRHLLQGWRPGSLCLLRQGWLCGAVGAHLDQVIWG